MAFLIPCHYHHAIGVIAMICIYRFDIASKIILRAICLCRPYRIVRSTDWSRLCLDLISSAAVRDLVHVLCLITKFNQNNPLATSAESTLTRMTLNPRLWRTNILHRRPWTFVTSNITSQLLHPAGKAIKAEDMINDDCSSIIINDDQSFPPADQPNPRNSVVNSSINYIHGLQNELPSEAQLQHKHKPTTLGISDTEALANKNRYHLLSDNEHRPEVTHARPG